MCILGRAVGNFHVICESLPGIVTSYEGNLSKKKGCNNSRRITANVIKIIQGIDWTMVKRLWRLTKVCKESPLYLDCAFPGFTLFFNNTEAELLFRNLFLQYESIYLGVHCLTNYQRYLIKCIVLK